MCDIITHLEYYLLAVMSLRKTSGAEEIPKRVTKLWRGREIKDDLPKSNQE